MSKDDEQRSTISRRGLFKAGAAAGAVIAAGSALDGLSPDAANAAAFASASTGATSLSDIEHIVILMQENRPFDHYFGTLSGVRGFSDKTAMKGVFKQLDPDLVQNGAKDPYLMPWRFDTKTTSALYAGGNEHNWSDQHFMWNEGLMNQFVIDQRVSDDVLRNAPNDLPLTDNGSHVMAYYTREDIPYYYALADAFTICDNYHCSVLGPTNPNRLMHISGTIDHDGSLGGGPVIDNTTPNNALKWESYSQRLQNHGVDWYVYQEESNNGDNLLVLFDAFRDTKTDLYRRGNSFIPTPAGQLPGPALYAKIEADVKSGNLPAVSWVYSSFAQCEHPEASPADGAEFTAGVLNALMSDPAVWAKTLMILNYDENDGKFDHVKPPTAPVGTEGEYISLKGDLSNPSSSFGLKGPIGLGFRVPLLLMSPMTRGGLVASDVYDHTSVLRLLESKFGVEVPYISKWRREVVSDLTSAINFAKPDYSIPDLPDAAALAAAGALTQSLPAPTTPKQQVMPVQERGPQRPKPSGIYKPK